MAQVYDVIVMGTQPAGLIAAGLLAKKRRRVLLVDHGETITHYRRQGYRLPLGPMLLPTFDSSAIASKVHEQLGIGPELHHQTETLSPSFQAILADYRLDLFTGRDALATEIAAEFPELKGSVEHFIDEVQRLNKEAHEFLSQHPPVFAHNWKQRLSLKRRQREHESWAEPFESDALLQGIPKDHPLREALLGPLTFFHHLFTQRPSKLMGARLLGRYFSGTMAFSDPLFGLEAILLKACERAGVELRQGAVVESLHTKGRRIDALQLRGRPELLQADYFISNTLESPSSMINKGRIDKLLAEDASFQTHRGLLVMNVRIPDHAVPKGMGRALFVLNGRRQQRDGDSIDTPMLVERHPAQTGPRGKAPASQSEGQVLTVSTPVAIDELRRSPAKFQALQSTLIARLGRVVPFLKQHTIDISFPVEVGTWDKEQGEDQRIDPWQIHPLYELEQNPTLGFAARPPKTTAPNLFRCGPQTFPGLGLEGQYLAGIETAKWITVTAGKKWSKVAK